MNIIQKIKAIFRFNKVKKLEPAKEVQNKDTNFKSNKENLLDLKSAVKEVTKTDRVTEFLKFAGCNKEVFLRVDDFEDIDVENLNNILKLLCDMGLNKQEVNVVLGQNIDLLNTPNIAVENNINNLKEYIKDKDILKNIIYTNPYVLTDDIEQKISAVKVIFKYLNISIKEQAFILDENSNILSLDEEILNKSINVIQKYCKTKIKTKQAIQEQPLIVGIIDTNTLKQYIEE